MSLHVFSYPFGFVAGDDRTKNGPMKVKHSPYLKDYANQLHWGQDPNTYELLTDKTDRITRTSSQLAQQTKHACSNNELFLTVGGDHSCAIGTWSGAAHAVQQRGQSLGLIWIDAHMDAHTYDTSMTKNIHGMPLAVLLGHGDSRLTSIASSAPKIKPENLCLIGIRSYEPEEKALLDALGVKIFYMPDIERLSLATVMKQALCIVTAHTDAFGISIDVDGFDPKYAPAVATTVDNGIDANDMLDLLPTIFSHPQLIGTEIAEFNPAIDQDEKTEKLISNIIQLILEAQQKNTKP